MEITEMIRKIRYSYDKVKLLSKIIPCEEETFFVVNDETSSSEEEEERKSENKDESKVEMTKIRDDESGKKDNVES